MPVSFTVNRSTVLRTDNDGDNVADAGDVLRHTLTFTNTGDTDALNVVVNDLLGGSTETGLMNISPIAFNDAFTAVGNTTLLVGGAVNPGSGPASVVSGNLLANDVGSTTVGVGALAGDDVTGFTIFDIGTKATVGGGSVTINADGSFSYISQAGDTGTDSFTYTIRDAGINGIAGDADDTSSTATVTITLSGQVWYVAAGGTGDGTSANPFGSITAFNAANGGLGVDGANDYIYVQGNVSGQLVLEQGEHLIGTGADLDVAGFHLADDGARSTITGSSGFTVTLAGAGTGNNEIAGINIIATGGAANHGLTGTSFGNLTINNTTIDASGQGLVLSTGAIVAGSTGLVSTDSDGGTNNVSLTSVTGTLALGTGALSGATGTAFNVSGGSVSTTYSGNVSQASASQALVNVTGGHTGTLTFSTGTLSATNGTGLQFDNADGAYNFNGTNTLNGGDAGVDIVNGSGGAFSFSSNSAITNATGIAFNVNGGAGNIDYNGTISHTANTRAISVQNHTGGTVSFDGTVSATGSSDGLLFATNTGAIINLTNQLTINAAGANFDASGGGTITATGSGNVISSGTATALSVVNTNIGLGGLNFVSISSSGATSGIVLNNTGTTAGVHGGLTVTGDGGSAVNASGGTINNSTGVGISLTSTRAISLDQMTISNGLDDGINGNTVTNFSLTNSTVTNNGNALQEHGAEFDNLFGTGVFTNVTFSNNETSQVNIINTSGTADVQFSNVTVSSTGVASAPNGLHGIHMETQGTATADLRILNSSFNNLFSNSVHATNEGTGTFEVTIANSTFNNVGASAINIVQNNSGTVRFWVHDNPTFLRGSNNGTSHTININQAGGVPAGALMEGRINNNVIGNNTSSTSASSGGGGIQVLSVGSGTTTVQIDNNNIQGVLQGINVQMSEDTNVAHTMNATIFSNTVLVTDINGFDGIRVVAGALSGDAGTFRLDMHDNTASASVGNDFTVRPRFNTTMQLLNYAGGALDTAAVQNYLDNTRANNAAHNTWFLTPSNAGVFANTASVPTPTLPSPLLVGVTPPPEQPAETGGGKGTGNGTGGELPTPGGGDPAPAPTPSNQPVVVDDGVLSQAELNLIINAAIDRWAEAGATAEQLAAMRATTFSVADISGLSLAMSSGGHITIDVNAAGFSWFIDATPGEDGEYSGTGTRLTAAPDSQAGVRIDLLTTIMHELGHQIGLSDDYDSAGRDELMYGMINPGERRLPGNDDLTGASGAPLTGVGFALSPVSIGTVPAGRTVTIQWDSTVDAFLNQIVPTFNNTSSISGSNFVTVNSNTEVLGPTSAPLALDSVTLGNLVFFDANNNGTFDGADVGINGVALTLFADTNANGVFDSGVDVQLATTTTAGGGLYSFANLAPGDYIVRVDAANFTAGGALVGRLTSTGGSDPDNNTDLDDNGVNAAGGIVVSQAITLTQNGETTNDVTGHLDINNTLDFGFIQLNQPPVNTVPGTQTINEDATLTFTGGTAISVNDPDVGAGNLTVTISVLNGQLTLSGTAGLAFANGDGTDDTSMTFSGTQAAVNAALAGLLYETTLDYNGSDTLTIVTNDNGNTGSDPGTSGGPTDEEDTDTVTINITAVADIVTDTPTVGEDSGASNLDLLANDTFENPGGSITAVTQGLHGFVSINDNNTIGDTTDDFVVYTPVADYNGPDTFTYTVTSGGVTEVGTVNVTVTAVADIADDSPTTAEDTAVNVLVQANDTFENGGHAITAVGAALHGTAVLNDAGTPGDGTDDYIVYTPDPDYNGADSFTYQVTSGGVTETATVNVTVTAVADIADDSVGVVQDSVDNALDLLANDSFEDSGRAITAVGAALHGTTAIDDNGTAGDSSDDFVTYTPTGGYTGPDSFTYTVTSGGVMETATVAVNVAPANLPPAVDLNTGTGGIDDTNLYVENGSPSGIGTTIDVTDPDAGDNIESATITITDPEAGDLLSVTLPLPPGISVDTVNSTATTLILIGSATPAAYASALGQVGYENTTNDPTDGGTNTNRVITVVVNDGTSNSAAATMTMSIATDDDPSVAQDDDVTTDEATPVSGSLFVDNGHGPDTDPDSAPAISTINGGAFTFGVQFALPSGALLTVNADGTFDYDPNGVFDPTPTSTSGAVNQPDSDEFTYELVGGSTATVTITINGVDTIDTLIGTAGADTLDGGAGADTMSGLGGDDDYYVDNAGDVVNEAIAGGTDRVITTVSYTLATGSEVERLETDDLSGTTAMDLTGNEFANTIVGNNGGNILRGEGGNDILSGQDNDDYLVGGTGDDAMNGDLGNDTYYVDSAADAVSEAVGGGNDRVAASASYALDAGAEVETLEAVNISDTTALNLTGNDFANRIIGNNGDNILSGGGDADVLLGLDGNDFLSGGTGADTMSGGDGDDTYYVDDPGDIVNEAGGEGFDRIAATSSYVLDSAAAVEVLEATNLGSTNAMDLTGNDFVNAITGNDGANILFGNGGADVLVGGGGGDVLVGGTGGDTMSGNAGDDTYYIDSSTDIVYEAVGEGSDRIATSVSFTLVGGVEIELIEVVNSADTTMLNLTGNEFDNIIVGNAGNNVIDGGDGDDILVGLGGADHFRFTTALGPDNADVIGDFVSGTDRIVLENEVFDQLTTGALLPSQFRIGTSATDEDQRILYDSATGNLYYDTDGIGALAPILFAKLEGHPTLLASDFTVI